MKYYKPECYSSKIRKYITLSTLMIILSCLNGCNEEKNDNKISTIENKKSLASKEKSVLVETEAVKKTDLKILLPLVGSVDAIKTALLASPAEGPVNKILVREGDVVKAGQILLTLGRSEGANILAVSLQQQLKMENDNLSRIKLLVDAGALAADQLDTQNVKVAGIQAQLANAQESVKDFSLRAPWSGMLSRVKVKEGDFVSPRVTLVEMYDPQSLVIRVSVSEQSCATLVEGMYADVELDAYPNQKFSASVVKLYPYLDVKSRTRTIELALANKPILLPGMFARVNLITSEIPAVIAVPENILTTVSDSKSKLFVMKDGKAEQRNITTGLNVGGKVQVVSGLQPGEKIIVSGYEKLKNGLSVTQIKKESSESSKVLNMNKNKTPLITGTELSIDANHNKGGYSL